ncbi:putative regulator of septum formation [Sediminihabitans luteus]|uniref:Putative regulator of septum formation n=1 Tax=Sediminihabitans luteus TaxID=1138585 RepID=A0A2M9CED5_9CELL|nr:septum formation family protein [Sediminihabitans luteus]PJJ70215.1 putative regulator of septum formation [Sediminihabitans luteus]GII97686.1 hypothetical protein Slu03_00640 [Sediminihabitans luteus]
MTRPSPQRRAVLLSLAVAATLATSGCSAIDGLLGPGEAQREESSGTVTAASDADVFSLRVGDCLDTTKVGDDTEQLTSLPVVPCADEHDAEIYAETTLPEGDWPGEDAVAATADEFCHGEYADFVGLDYDSSKLEYWPLTPVKEGWNSIDDRLVQCVLQSAEAVTGSLEGSAV